MKVLHKYRFLILIAITLATCASHKKICTNILNDLNQNKNIINKKFDIDLFKKNNEQGSYRFALDDGAEVLQIELPQIKYVERINFPDKFYNIYKEYYPDGKIKLLEYRLYDIKFGSSEHYDKQGNKTLINEDEKFGKFDYNQLILFLNKKNYVDIQKRNWKNVFELEFDNDKKLWEVYINGEVLRQLVIDGNSGKIIRTNRIYVYE
ncbi:MAG: hypothetical protein FWF54_05440 [Candidatus Azobacteroides sp.]|nr:hypothetical protein [Candidatus Azobacteroides sp.]